MTLKYTEKISFAVKRLQPSFNPSKDSYATVARTPPQSARPLPPWARKIRLPIDFKAEIEYLKYILNYCLTRLDTLDEITPENPVPRDAPSSVETPPPPQTTPEQKNETTIPNTESALQSAASNDIINDENEIEMLTMSSKKKLSVTIVLKRTPPILFQQKRLPLAPQLVSSLTPVCQKAGEAEIDLRSLPSLSTLLTLEDGGPGREISLLHGFPVSHQTQVRDPPLKPPGTIKRATKGKTKSKEKIHLRKSWLTTT